MLVKLPFNFNAGIQTECWTFYKVAILSAYPQFIPWLNQHCNNLFLTGNFQLAYGENCRLYDQYRYFEQVLCVEEADCTLLDTEEDALWYIKDKLSHQEYILLECDFTGTDIEGDWQLVRECLIYGMDTQNQTVYVPYLQKGRWISSAIKLSILLQAHRKSRGKKDYLHESLRLLQYRATLFRPVFTGKFAPSLHIFWKDIRYIYKSNNKEIRLVEKAVEKGRETEHTVCQIYWDGYNACLSGMIAMVKKLLAQEWILRNLDDNLALTFKRLWEYRVYSKLRNSSLEEHFVPEYLIKNQEYEERNIQLLRNASLFALKYTHYQNEKNLKAILKILHEVKDSEDYLLDDLYIRLSDKIGY